MQDRFKFRYQFDNKIWDVSEIDFDNQTLELKVDAFEAIHIKDFKYENLVQCTGLKDKNGKLIFEGDLLKANRTYFTSIGEIKFGLDRNENLGFFLDWHDKFECIRQDLQYWLPWVEVIGNIYENPELLEVEE